MLINKILQYVTWAGRLWHPLHHTAYLKTVVGLATTRACVNAVAGSNEVALSLALDWLAPGKYIVKLTAYSVNEFGTNLMHDVVENAFAFEKEQEESTNNKMKWNHTWWGFMMFPELEII